MFIVREIVDNLYYIGMQDRKITLFENSIPLNQGVSYNSYLYKGDKNILLDTVEVDFLGGFMANIEAVLDGESLDYVIVHHMEPDHSSSLKYILDKYPNAKVICTMMAQRFMRQFDANNAADAAIIVKDNEEIELGGRKFRFYSAPNVHWPEVMFTYDIDNHVLFSADAFGSFHALNGNIIDSEITYNDDVITQYRRYYTNIVGKYGVNVLAALKKVENVEIDYICPLHYAVLKDNIGLMIKYYLKWASYTPESKSVMMVYASAYGNTTDACEFLANELGKKGVRDIKMYDVCRTPIQDLLAESFRVSDIVFASSTLNSNMFPQMLFYIEYLKDHNFKNRNAYLIENGTWASLAAKKMNGLISDMKDFRISENVVSIKSTANNETLTALKEMADDIYNNLNK